MVEQHFCLRWNNYRTNITAEFETLREGEHFVDVTLACDGKQLKAHKVVLSACSPYFKELLQGNPCSHPIIILRDVAYTHMRSLLEFMYAGEVNISQAHLGSFLHTAEALKIRGLAESSEDRKEHTRGSNSLSPLSALKTSLGSFGGISLGSLGPSLLERPVMPQLLPHPRETDSLSNFTQSSPHLVPASLSFPSTSYVSPPSSSSSVTHSAITGRISSPDKTHGDIQSHGLITTTLNSNSNDLNSRIKGEICEYKDSTSPISLPPNKRIRIESKGSVQNESFKEACGDKIMENTQNGCSYISANNSSVSPVDTATFKHTSLSTNDSSAPMTEEINQTIPKTEPVDQPISDNEGSMGWPDEGESCSGIAGRDSYTPPDAPPSNTSHSSTGLAGTDSKTTSHLLQALSSESHLPDEGGVASISSAPPGPSYSGPAPSREVPRSCPYCTKLISNFYNLKKHITTMHQAPAFYHACCHCSATFRTPEYLRKHLVNVHKYPVKKKK